MNYGFYEVDAWGDLVAHTASAPRWCTMSGVAKTGGVGQPYVVPNEFICGRLGLMIGLPVPPGVCVRTDANELAYVALRFGPKGELPPPAIPEHLVEDNPFLAAGVIAFDCWIGNQDRHPGNLAYARDVVSMQVFDHSHALLGSAPGDGVAHLTNMMEQGVVSSCLAAYVKTSKNFGPWAARVDAVPDEVIRDLVGSVTCEGGLTSDEGKAAYEFLATRNSRILELLGKVANQMPQITDWEVEK